MTATLAVPTQVRTRAVVVADLDGTVSFDDRPPGPKAAAALRLVADHPGFRLVLASSRPPPAIRRLVGGLTDRADLIACNGALCVSRDGLVARTAFPEAFVDTVVAALVAARDDFCLDYGDWFLASTPDALPWKGTSERRVLDRRRPPAGALKIATPTDVRRAMLGRLAAGRAHLIRHETRGDVEVVPAGVTKATGLDVLLGPDRPPVIALGNDTNDLEMLTSADHGIVVGDGLRHLDQVPHLHRVAGHDTAVASALTSVLRGFLG